MIVLDTHVWVNWLLLGESSLTPSIISAMANERHAAVSAIYCCEWGLVMKVLPFGKGVRRLGAHA